MPESPRSANPPQFLQTDLPYIFERPHIRAPPGTVGFGLYPFAYDARPDRIGRARARRFCPARPARGYFVGDLGNSVEADGLTVTYTCRRRRQCGAEISPVHQLSSTADLKPRLLRGAHTGNPLTCCVSFSPYRVGEKVTSEAGSTLYPMSSEEYNKHGYVALPGSTPLLFPHSAPIRPNTRRFTLPTLCMFYS